ncbi:tryptophan 2,3-dioxygenase [Rhizohabitans arisaemae]|uniref:tryptophan 2,3-dioxygenase n=1 Tax=Rhizohabitans arisaemae TaxID=2720610 RepID=UPI0024B20713|nr:tryptophan 2,3-dioxygenase family protein [Rhizohabitans arisaemae]
MTSRRVVGSAAGVRERVTAQAEGDNGPTLEYEAGNPYDEYVGAQILHGLLKPRTDVPEERAFLVISQVMELYFGLIRAELLEAQRLLDADDVVGATTALGRSVRHFDGLNATWQSLSWMTPVQFNSFRPALGEASGFQSAGYRHLEFLFGNKSEPMTRPHRRTRRVYAELQEALAKPSLYDSVLDLLSRRGYKIPGDRDLTVEYVPMPEVEAAWVAIYGEQGPGGELWNLAEALMDLSEKFSDWRYRHIMAVRRAMGAKAGTGGSTGLAWLERSLRREVFPELWSARTVI